MKIYFGQFEPTKKWYAYSLIPHAEFWGNTQKEATDKIVHYLDKQYGIAITDNNITPRQDCVPNANN